MLDYAVMCIWSCWNSLRGFIKHIFLFLKSVADAWSLTLTDLVALSGTSSARTTLAALPLCLCMCACVPAAGHCIRESHVCAGQLQISSLPVFQPLHNNLSTLKYPLLLLLPHTSTTSFLPSIPSSLHPFHHHPPHLFIHPRILLFSLFPPPLIWCPGVISVIIKLLTSSSMRPFSKSADSRGR